MKEPNVELVTKGAGHRSVNELSTSHGRAIRKRHDDFLAATAGDFCEIVETNSNHGAVLGADEAVAVSFDEVPEGLEQCFGAWLVVIGDGGVEGFLEVSNTALGIGNTDGAQAVDDASYAYAALFRFVAAFFRDAGFSVFIDFFQRALPGNKFGTQLPRRTAGFKLLRV